MIEAILAVAAAIAAALDEPGEEIVPICGSWDPPDGRGWMNRSSRDDADGQ